MKEEAVKVLSISQLLQSSRPVTSASSLNPKISNFPSESSAKIYSFDDSFEPYQPSNPIATLRNPNPKILKPLNHQIILIGTITLPFYEDTSTSSTAVFNPKTSSFSFSDGSATIDCDILDFELRVIGKRIHVLAWNFIPLNCAGGFLEIIRWRLPEFTSGLGRCSADSVAYSLSSGSAIDCKITSKARYHVHGQLESVSPVSVIPCKMGVKSDSSPNASRPGNICGFLTQILVFDSKSSVSKDSVLHLQDTAEGKNSHRHTKSVIVYFCGSASSWHPVLSRLVGNVVSLSRLKKKLVFIGKLESKLMYVTPEKALFHLPIANNPYFTFQKTNIERQGGFGNYTGTVTGTYMQGMVVELDQQVLLLLTEQQLTTPLNLRIGAIVSVRNVHFVNPKFSWTKVLVLGACCKSSIRVKSFSPIETGCHIFSQSQSLMWKYLNSLEFSAKLWALLVLSCFGKKFSGLLSEKQIFGSKHKEGWAQKYSASCLPLSVFHFRHGVFTEYCNHGSCCCGYEQNCGCLKLAVPLSNFINHCEATGMKLMLEQESDSDLVRKNIKYGLLSCEGKSHPQSIRRVMQSEDTDTVLIGKLKISPSSGKLQLIDATGSIDVVIPELSSTWCSKSIYEVHDFTVVMEGIPGQSDCLSTPLNEPFSCRSIFNSVPLVRESSLSIYLYFHLRDETSRNCPLYPGMDCEESYEELGSGRFHLLYITHKFPVLQKGDQVVSNRSSVFAEAIILPWDLFISKIDGETCPTSKRCKTDVTSRGTHLNSCYSRYTHEIPCLVTGKSVKGHCPACSGTLKFNSRGKQGSRKVLLEFEYNSFSKYKLLKIGGHYITENQDGLKSDKFVITAKIHLWSVLFSSDEVLPKLGQSLIPPCEEDSLQTEQHVLRFSSADSQFSSDRCMFLSADDLSFLAANLKVLKEGLLQTRVSLREVDNMSISSMESSGTSTSDYCLPEGNLISLNGRVVGVHDSSKSSLSSHPNEQSYCGDVHQPNIFGVTSSVCIHVQVDNRNVRIFSSLSRNTYPTGFGPGVNATFHRILVSGRNAFMMIAASFIVSNSITIVNEKYSGRCDKPLVPLALQNLTTQEAIPAAMISEIIRSSGCKLMELHCQVLAVYVLVLEKNASVIDIPLAGFILDDGSSSCCCWANNRSAATLLRLHVDGKAFNSPISHHVDKILKQHQRIVVKNYGSLFDSFGQDLRFSAGSGNNIMSVSYEELLKFVILNSCFSSSWSIVGGIMDSDATGELERRLMELDMTMPPHQLQNIWATEIFHSDPLKKARSIAEELLNSL